MKYTAQSIKMSISQSIFWALLLALAVSLGGCCVSPYLDAHWGESVHAVSQQQARPTVPRSERDEADGLEGRAAEALMNRYYKSFEEPPKPAGSAVSTIGGSHY